MWQIKIEKMGGGGILVIFPQKNQNIVTKGSLLFLFLLFGKISHPKILFPTCSK
jgi:hypothetical protein